MDKIALEKLISELPTEVAKLITKAIQEENPNLWVEALGMVNFPTLQDQSNVYVRPDQLTEDQKILAILSAHYEFFQKKYAFPETFTTRKRWWGVAEQGVLEQEFDVVVNEKPTHEYLWRALQRSIDQKSNHVGTRLKGCVELLNSLPFIIRFQAITELFDHPQNMSYHYNVNPDHLIKHTEGFHFLEELKDEGKEWAPKRADQLIEKAQIEMATNKNDLGLSFFIKKDSEPMLIFLSLVRANIPIDPKWDVLLPIENHECIRAIPAENDRRTKTITSKLIETKRHFPDSIVKIGMTIMVEFPSLALLTIILEASDKVNYTPQRIILEKLKEAVEVQPDLLLIVEEKIASLAKVETLHVLSAQKPQEQSELSKIQQEQLQFAFTNYDGKKLSIEERFTVDDPEVRIQDNNTEFIVFGNEKRSPLYDVYLMGGDSGSIYKSGTLDEVASMIQGSLKCKNKTLKEVLELALYKIRSKAR